MTNIPGEPRSFLPSRPPSSTLARQVRWHVGLSQQVSYRVVDLAPLGATVATTRLAESYTVVERRPLALIETAGRLLLSYKVVLIRPIGDFSRICWRERL